MGTPFSCSRWVAGDPPPPPLYPPAPERMSADSSVRGSEERAVEPNIDLGKGLGGLQMIRMTHSSGCVCEVYLWGATVTSYRLGSGKEILFVSPDAVFDGVKAIRGGIPVVFPQFGQPNKDMPSHGFARIQNWTIDKKQCSIHKNGMLEVVLTLEQSEQTLKMWPFEFQLEYAIRLSSDSLQTALTIHNPHLVEWSFQTLLHSYLRVPDIATTSVSGLKGASYIDKVDEGAVKTETSSEVRFSKRTDRIYRAATGGLGVVAAATVKSRGRDLVSVEATCSRAANSTWSGATPSPDLVVWNPFPEASPSDLKDGYKHMICVEPGLVSEAVTTLLQGRMTLTQTIFSAEESE
uniref:glucose-6-phosphate 1-epimerase n=1 Tax=Rhizochromulina marina TaxID=1034831 RepID=A0A7S2WLW6_9STRA|mmetsp:Transcript_2798/g.8017  ORF Transcript_2798/g.8017 Transcript_2798/m.8017 type:complete len:350 (+) Transcript_2798:112-1161(+)